MKDFFSKLFNQVKEAIRRFLDTNASSPSPTPVVTPIQLPIPTPTPTLSPVPPVLTPSEEEEPAVSDPYGFITSFLWKPESDTTPKGIVISVSSDTLRAEDVRVTLKDSFGKIIKANDKYNMGGLLRGNKLPGHKYGRFNFKPGGSAESYSPSKPLTVSFTLVLNGKSTPIKVMDKFSIEIKDPSKRLDSRSR